MPDWLQVRHPQKVLEEWREIGTTGSTDGSYGYRRKQLKDMGWLVENWGVNAAAVQALVKGAIEMGTFRGLHLDMLLKHCPDVAKPVLDDMRLVHIVLDSGCATGSEQVRRNRQADMLACLAEGGFLVEPRDKAAVQTLRHKVHSERAEYARKQKVTAQNVAKEQRKIHTGRLETFEMDLSDPGFDSTELRHLDRVYQLWSCCKRGPHESGCQLPPV